MPTTLTPLRRGLPRVPGGEPWPPPGVVEVEDRPGYLAEAAGDVPAGAPAGAPAASAVAAPETPVTPVAAPAPTAAGGAPVPELAERRVPLRRGLPRVPGGEPWPPAGTAVLTVPVQAFDLGPTAAPVADPGTVREAPPAAAPLPAPAPSADPAPAEPAPAAPRPAAPVSVVRVPLRRGLPRTADGEPWPAAGFGLLSRPVVEDEPPAPPATPEPIGLAAASVPVAPPVAPEPDRAPTPVPAAKAAPVPSASRPARTLALLTAAWGTVRRFPALAVVALVVLVGAVMMAVRALLGTDVMATFLVRYPGTYPLPDGAEPGFAGWVRWSHFLNLFFIVLIIRTGLQVRYERKPAAYWTPRWSSAGGKISLSSWLHQSLDVLWLLNGLVFGVLLFATDHWMRLVPTSWAVFPNALSALLQYLALDWPTESGWVAYNGLQQLSYFVVVFVAAPLAAVTGFRMSGLWPTRARRLSSRYPVELARAVHVPTMIFFVVFVVMHVTMVFATGALRNLNHMFAGTDATSWTGFWVFVGALAVLAAAWELARPLVLAPLASRTGRVSQR